MPPPPSFCPSRQDLPVDDDRSNPTDTLKNNILNQNNRPNSGLIQIGTPLAVIAANPRALARSTTTPVQWIIKRFKAADTEVVSKNPTRKEHAAMSLSGSLAAAVAGLTAQSRALGHISDNVANSQTTGYKRVESRFNTLVTTSTSSLHSPGGVRATPFRMNDVQGTVTSSAQVTNMALLGSGFLAASKVNGVATACRRLSKIRSTPAPVTSRLIRMATSSTLAVTS
jgi:hypothetical protein